MAPKCPFIRFKLNKSLRKALELDYKHREIFIYQIHGIAYLSPDKIPLGNTECTKLKAKIGYYNIWFINIPLHLIGYMPARASLIPDIDKVVCLVPYPASTEGPGYKK